MSDFEEKLNAILSSPETMAQVMNIAQSLGMGSDSQPVQQEKNDPSPPSTGDIGNLFSTLDPAMLTRLLPLLGELNADDNNKQMQLLYALSPYLKQNRQEKLEKALRMAKLISVGKKLIGTLGEHHV